MNPYIIITDSSSDLPEAFCEGMPLEVAELDVIVAGEPPRANRDVDNVSFYAKLREKKTATTAAVNLEKFLEVMEPYAARGYDILYLGFSSGLSGTYSAGAVAVQEFSQKYPAQKFYAVDTLAASLGQGLLVYLALRMQRDGADIDTVRDFVESNKLHLAHWFTVDDLFFLKRGGRVSATTAVAGTLLSIKPVMHMDNEGHLIKVSTVRGRRASLDALLEKMKQTAIEPASQTVFISHGDCVEDAEYLANRIRNELGVSDVRVDYVGAVIGAHSGPGTVALFYLATER
ncbi:MAG: DegV family protein [Ruminococcaceae bacterium]|nr:DegV family protein [Oscillospiraceae bacterium]